MNPGLIGWPIPDVARAYHRQWAALQGVAEDLAEALTVEGHAMSPEQMARLRIGLLNAIATIAGWLGRQRP